MSIGIIHTMTEEPRTIEEVPQSKFFQLFVDEPEKDGDNEYYRDDIITISHTEKISSRFIIKRPLAIPECVIGKDSVGVSLEKLGPLLRWARIRDLHLHTYYGDATKEDFGISGCSPTGEALAGKASVVEAERSKHTLDQSEDITLNARQDVSIGINLNELNERIKNEEEWPKGIRSVEAWAYHFNSELVHQIISAGREFYTKQNMHLAKLLVHASSQVITFFACAPFTLELVKKMQPLGRIDTTFIMGSQAFIHLADFNVLQSTQFKLDRVWDDDTGIYLPTIRPVQWMMLENSQRKKVIEVKK